MPVAHRPCLFNFDVNGSPERSTADLPFISMGSGQAIADPFLALLRRLLWHDQEPTLAEGRLAAVWTIDHVCQTNPGGVAGEPQLSILVGAGGTKMPEVHELSTDDIDEHRQRVASAEQTLVEELRGLSVKGQGKLPELPLEKT